ncbi:uncharacterized protein TRIVIDRAFT_218799 [Trichoderma virens Gv29-8]|uniref:Argininosuccinate lyase C-terminal domain-containing protein n=1 Tax=Hypocrea virens (strain Gv29-8 / FGSC 10586) TaxID=413071 RepID=G9MGK6_HYPVG|nr:uncharacterized protein TRIVIDRAFT_218799 [Trichoderma virens Gv29-8]EHK26653.1 hypothetical protein TRIVIDRAFT_218799 [Trichoderma virens Gv29-8]UKZ46828.1 hypothetical protein TrVGV298_001039 [Trichoderma virens]
MLSYGFAFVSDLERLGEVIKRVNRTSRDRDMITKELGFDCLIWNSMASVSDRDFVSETLQWAIARQEWPCFWSHGWLDTQKALPSTYKKDLQEVSDSIHIANGVLATLKVDGAMMKAALDPFMLATGAADYLVRKGVPFRETHHISGQCVAKSEETGIPMNELSFEQLKAIDSRFEEGITETFVYETSVERRSAKGDTSKSLVLEQI